MSILMFSKEQIFQWQRLPNLWIKFVLIILNRRCQSRIHIIKAPLLYILDGALLFLRGIIVWIRNTS